MSDSGLLSSILAVDCGNLFTRATLLDVVDGQFRLLGQGRVLSTHRPPAAHIMPGVVGSTAQLEAIVGRELVDKRGMLIMPERESGQGVDTCAVSISAGEPLRVFLAGLARDVSLASARRALSSCPALVADTLSLEDRLDQPESIVRLLERLDQAKADITVLVGGVDGGASRRVLDMAGVLALAYQARPEEARPPVVYAGDSGLQEQVRAVLENLCPVRVVENLRPALDVENSSPLAEAVQRLYMELRAEQLPGFETLRGWSHAEPLLASQAMRYTLGYLSARYALKAVALQVGAGQSAVYWASDGQSDAVMRPYGGLKHGPAIVAQRGMDMLRRWIPEPPDPDEAWEMLYNLSLYPSAVPGGARELRLMHALTRELVMGLLEEARPALPQDKDRLPGSWDLIILSGSIFENVATPGQSALMMLDALQPAGISTVVVDALSLATAAGTIAPVEPLAAAHLLERDAFLGLGTVIAPYGQGKKGRTALRLRVRYEDGRTLDVEVQSGAVEVIPLGLGQKARLEIQPAPGLDVGWKGRGRKAVVEVDGGTLGIVVDARGRPLPLGGSPAEQQARVQQWHWQIGA
ncbi:MAG: glutamate mutase L [Anaerolineae bacterium]